MVKAKSTPRERVIATANRLFYEQGYQATGINQIIDEASVAKASLYQLFRSKDDLLVEYLVRREHDWWADFDAFREGTPEGKKMILSLFDYRIRLIQEDRYRGCCFKRIAYELPDLEGPAADIIREHSLAIKALVANHLKIHNPGLTRLEASDLCELIVNLYEGSGIQAFLFHHVKPAEDARRTVQRLLA